MHSLTKKLLQGIEDLKRNSQTPIVGGTYKQVFEIFMSQTVGDISLSSPENLDRVAEQLKGLPLVSGRLDDLNQVFLVAKNHCVFGVHELRLDRNKGLSEQEIQKKGVDLIAKSIAHVTITTNLPETHAGNAKIIQRSSAQIFSKGSILEMSNLQSELKTVINDVVKDSQAPQISPQTVEGLASKATSAIKDPPSSMKIFALAALLASVLTTQLDTDISPTPVQSQEESEDEETQTPILGQAIGAGLGLREILRKPEEATPPETPVTTPLPVSAIESEPTPSAPSPSKFSLGSVFSKVTSLFNKGGVLNKALTGAVGLLSGGVGLVAKGLALVGTKLLSGLLGLFGRSGQDTDHTTIFGLSEKASSLLPLIVVGLVLLVFGIALFIVGNLIPSAIVDNLSQASAGSVSVVNTPTPPTTTQLTPTSTPSISLTITPTPFESSIVPEGFPVDSSCVTQPPGGPYSHGSLNAVDVGRIADNNAWLIRATHPGTVIWAGDFGTYGLAVVLESSDKNFITYYGHIRRGSIMVWLGKQVKKGDRLGIVNNTGKSTGDHLHYEIRGPRSIFAWFGSKSGPFGTIGTIYYFLPYCKTWSCQGYCIY